MCELLVSDKLKTCLPPGTLNYVLSLEGDEWYSPSKVAGLADTYVANHDSRTMQNQGSKFRPSTSNGNGVDKSYQGHPKTTSGQRSPHLNERGRGNPGFRSWGRGRGNATNGQGERHCFTCNAIGHITTHCPNKQGGNNGGHSQQHASGRAQVNFCSTLQCVPESVESVISDECHTLVGEKECMSE